MRFAPLCCALFPLQANDLALGGSGVPGMLLLTGPNTGGSMLPAQPAFSHWLTHAPQRAHGLEACCLVIPPPAGGKSTLLRATCIAAVMAQARLLLRCGDPAAAEAAALAPCSCLTLSGRTEVSSVPDLCLSWADWVLRVRCVS